MHIEIEKALEKHRKNTKYPIISIETNTPIPKDKIFEFILKTDQTTKGAGFSNMNGIVQIFKERSGIEDFKRKAFRLSDFEHGFLDFNSHEEIILDKSLESHLFETLVGHFETPFVFDSLFDWSGETLLNVKTGCISGEIYSGKYPSAYEILQGVKFLSTLDFIDVTLRLWDLPIGYNGYEDRDCFENLVSIKVNNGHANLIENDGKIVHNLNVKEIHKGIKLRPEMLVPMSFFYEYCEYVNQCVLLADPKIAAIAINSQMQSIREKS